jgi:hypothetical protein
MNKKMWRLRFYFIFSPSPVTNMHLRSSGTRQFDADVAVHMPLLSGATELTASGRMRPSCDGLIINRGTARLLFLKDVYDEKAGTVIRGNATLDGLQTDDEVVVFAAIDEIWIALAQDNRHFAMCPDAARCAVCSAIRKRRKEDD